MVKFVRFHEHMHHILSTHSFFRLIHLGWFRILASVNSAVTQIGVYDILWLIYDRNWIAALIRTSIFSFLRDFHSVPHNSKLLNTKLHSQNCRRIPFFPHILSHIFCHFNSYSNWFKMAGISLCFWFAFPWWLMSTLICFIFLLAIFISPLEKCLFKSYLC